MGTCELPKILDLLPDGFQSDAMVSGASEILHHLISSFEKDNTTEIIVPDEIKKVLGKQPYSNKGVMNWFNYYQPFLGSDKFIQYLLKLSKVNTEILPWYETNNPTNTFDLILDKYPGGTVNLDNLLTLINTYKNIEAKLASVRMEDCPIRFTLDNSTLDYDILSDTAGYSINGTTFCFRNISTQDPIQVNQTEFAMLRTKWTSLKLAYPYHETLDNTILGDKNIILEPSTQRMIVKSDPIMPIQYILGEAYDWRTFKAQQVLSDYGSLSGGEGFIGTYKHAPEVMLGTMILSGEIPFIEKIIDFYWNTKSQFFEATSLFDNIKKGGFKTSIGTYRVNDLESVHAYNYRRLLRTQHLALKKKWKGRWIKPWDASYEPTVGYNIVKSFIQYENIDDVYDVDVIRTISSRNIIETLSLNVNVKLVNITTKIRTEHNTLRKDWATSSNWAIAGNWLGY